MGWAKYDEDNRDYIEERWIVTGYMPEVFNYTANYRTSKRKNYVPAYTRAPYPEMRTQAAPTSSRNW